MDTERMIPNSRSSQNGSSPGSGQSGPTYHNASAISSNSNSMMLQHNSNNTGLVVNSVARKKKTERLVPPLIPNHSGLVNGHSSNAGIIGSVNGPPPMGNNSNMANTPPIIGNNTNNGGFMNSTSLYSPMPIQGNPNGGVANHGYTRDNNISVSNTMGGPHGNRMNTTGETTVSAQDDSDEQQEVIEVQILPQDEHWGENTTAVTINSDMDYNDGGGQGGFIANGTGGNGPPELEKWRLETERGMGFRCRRHMGPLLAGFLSMCALVSPILMAGLPKLGLFGSLRNNQLQCGVECDGMLVSLSFKLFVLAIGTWAVFYRNPRSTLPRIHIYRALVCLLIVVFLVSFWLFYASHILTETERVEYSGLVQFALHLVDALLFVHYLAIILIELRHTNAQFYVKVLRSPDGESKGFAIGQMSVQRAASWILDKYYTEFPIYNPFLDRLTGARNRKGIKVYDIDGNANDGNSTVVSQTSKKGGYGSHNERFYEEYEYDRKLKKRKARLVSAAEEAFTHIKRMQSNQQSKDKAPMESYEAAQAIFPTLSRPLQKYLRITRQQPRHSVESILQHLSTSLSYDLSPRAFLEKYIITTPVLQNEREIREVHSWSLVSERLLYRDIQPGTMFQLRQGDVSLLCQVTKLPHFHLSEEIIDHDSNKFVLRINSETSV